MGWVIAAWASMSAACCFAWWKGGRPERLVATTYATAALLSFPIANFASGPELWILVVDAAFLATLLYLALTTDRFWLLWATSFHAASVVTHLAVSVQPDVVPAAYAHYSIFWAYLVKVMLVVGTASHARRPVRLTN